ncbi:MULTISPECIES: hypothetical protein [Anaeromyxobacter]|uniref:hypothetical protein n=1 Tax=Anaeromyxobacter TaxID=161492 RepID=UPI001F5A375A|nr:MULTISPECIES: hypothetical protein [unclassified Anaeromyxobacter]
MRTPPLAGDAGARPAPRAIRVEPIYPAAFLLCAIATLVPIWSVDYLPMVDLPQHAAGASMWMHLRDPGWGFADRVRLDLATPYVLSPLLVRALAELAGIPAALHLVVSLAVIALPLAAARLLRAADGDPWASLAAFPAAFSFSFHWGFLPYLVAAPLAVALVAAAIRSSSSPSPRRALELGLLTVLVFFAHAMALAVAACAALAVIVHRAPGWRLALLRSLPLAAPVPLMIWIARARMGDLAAASRHADEATIWVDTARRITDLPGMIFGTAPDVLRDGETSGILSVTIALALAALVLLARAPRPRDLGRLAPLALVLALYFALPHHALAVSFIYERLTVFMVPFALLALSAPARPGRRTALARAGLVLLTLACMSVWTARFRRFDAEARGFDRIVDAVPPAPRLVALPWRSYSDALPGAPYYLHFGAWIQARRGGVLGYSFAETSAQVVRYRPGAKPPMTPTLNLRPDQFTWATDGWYDYFLARSFEDTGGFLFREATEPLELAAREGPWWLYRKRARAEPDTGARAAESERDGARP